MLHHELMQLVVDKQRRRDLGIKGREYIEKNHDSEMIAAQLVSLYESLLRARR
jgi:glycosyltransferase involved in cell wall biosynthesis